MICQTCNQNKLPTDFPFRSQGVRRINCKACYYTRKSSLRTESATKNREQILLKVRNACMGVMQ